MDEIMEKLGDFLASLSEAEDAGEKEFVCPLCGGTASWFYWRCVR